MKVTVGQLREAINGIIGTKVLRTTVKQIRALVREEAEYAVAVERLFVEPEQPVLRLRRRG